MRVVKVDKRGGMKWLGGRGLLGKGGKSHLLGVQENNDILA